MKPAFRFWKSVREYILICSCYWAFFLCVLSSNIKVGFASLLLSGGWYYCLYLSSGLDSTYLKCYFKNMMLIYLSTIVIVFRFKAE